MVLEAEMDIPFASHEVTASIATPDKLEEPTNDLPVDPTQPPLLLAITQGNY